MITLLATAALAASPAWAMREHGVEPPADLVDGGPKDLVRAGFRCTRPDQ